MEFNTQQILNIIIGALFIWGILFVVFWYYADFSKDKVFSARAKLGKFGLLSILLFGGIAAFGWLLKWIVEESSIAIASGQYTLNAADELWRSVRPSVANLLFQET